MPIDKFNALIRERRKKRLAKLLRLPGTIFITVYKVDKLPAWRWPYVVHSTNQELAQAACLSDELVLKCVDGQIVEELEHKQHPIVDAFLKQQS